MNQLNGIRKVSSKRRNKKSDQDYQELSIIHKGILALIALYFVLKPFYFWNSGLPQISDLFMILAIVFYIFSKKLNINLIGIDRKPIFLLILFTFYVVIVNLTWAMISQDFNLFIMNSLFYIYNSFVFLLFLSLYTGFGNYIYKPIYLGLFISLILEIVYIQLFSNNAYREIGTFNNPNQLGYFGLVTLTLTIILQKNIKMKNYVYTLCLLLSTVLCLYSLSKAAIIASLLVLIIPLSKMFKLSVIKKFYLFTGALILILLISELNISLLSTPLTQSVQERLLDIGSASDDNAEARGYNRITDHIEYLFLGAGEGAYQRFGEPVREFHSTFGNIILSYGILGLLIFLLFLKYCVLRERDLDVYIIITALFLYGLTHNGIRNTLVWILFALIMTTFHNRKLGDRD